MFVVVLVLVWVLDFVVLFFDVFDFFVVVVGFFLEGYEYYFYWWGEILIIVFFGWSLLIVEKCAYIGIDKGVDCNVLLRCVVVLLLEVFVEWVVVVVLWVVVDNSVFDIGVGDFGSVDVVIWINIFGFLVVVVVEVVVYIIDWVKGWYVLLYASIKGVDFEF